jgi:FdrA protein
LNEQSVTGGHVTRMLLVPNRYLDSISLLRLSALLTAVEGITTATAVMSAPANIARARENGIEVPDAASSNDLFIGVRGTEAACDEALATAEASLAAQQPTDDDDRAARPSPARSLYQFVRRSGSADLALISVPGAFAAAEAGKALDLGMHVMIFSDNVAIADEVALKTTAAERGLLVMGPDCGTAIVNGVPLGFANKVRRGPIAVIGASGTGMQEVTSRIHRLGGGISQALGCGGHDLSEAVGGRTMLQALEMASRDPATTVIVLVSKPPDAAVLARVLEGAREAVVAGKHVVAVLVGLVDGALHGTGVVQAPTLSAAADAAVALTASTEPRAQSTALTPANSLTPANARTTANARTLSNAQAATARALPMIPVGSNGAGRFVRGAFTGGTFCYEALSLLARAGISCESNLKGQGSDLATPAHLLVDFGDDEFTVGRPHPMIDPTVRDCWVDAALGEPSTAVVLLDVVLGHGANPDPVGALVGILDAHRNAEGAPVVIAHVCGTELDVPPRDVVVEQLRDVGVLVADSNDEAVRCAVEVVSRSSTASASTT